MTPAKGAEADVRVTYLEQHKQRIARHGFEPGNLQWALRTEDRQWTADEIEDGLIDAFLVMGGGTVWCGDGSSCAVQIVTRLLALANEHARAAERAGYERGMRRAAKLAHSFVPLRGTMELAKVARQTCDEIRDAILASIPAGKEK